MEDTLIMMIINRGIFSLLYRSVYVQYVVNSREKWLNWLPGLVMIVYPLEYAHTHTHLQAPTHTLT